MVSFGPALSTGQNGKHGATATMPHPHESPLAMTLPLMLLAVVTIVAGFIPFGHFISSNGEAYNIHLDWSVAGTSIAVAVVSIAIATYIYAGSRTACRRQAGTHLSAVCTQLLITASTWTKSGCSSPKRLYSGVSVLR